MVRVVICQRDEGLCEIFKLCLSRAGCEAEIQGGSITFISEGDVISDSETTLRRLFASTEEAMLVTGQRLHHPLLGASCGIELIEHGKRLLGPRLYALLYSAERASSPFVDAFVDKCNGTKSIELVTKLIVARVKVPPLAMTGN